MTSTGGVLVFSDSAIFPHLGRLKNAIPWTSRDRKDAQGDMHRFREGGHETWMWGVLPFDDDFEREYCAMISRLFSESAAREGRARWGIKDASWSPDDVEVIRRHWRDANIVYLYREFDEVMRSRLGWDQNTLNAASLASLADNWIAKVEFILSVQQTPTERLWKYESIRTEPERLTRWCVLPDPIPSLSVIGSSRVEEVPKWAEDAVADRAEKIAALAAEASSRE